VDVKMENKEEREPFFGEEIPCKEVRGNTPTI
jgi:hypothetical protein